MYTHEFGLKKPLKVVTNENYGRGREGTCWVGIAVLDLFWVLILPPS
jgi:hypothetical protein